MATITPKFVLDNLNQFVRAESCLADRDTFKVVMMDGGDDSLPRIQFRWQQKHSFYDLSTSERMALAAAGFKVEETEMNGKKTGWDCTVLEKRERTLTLCNFRRYGWAYTFEEAGEYGYGYGVTYANGNVFRAPDAQTVIRDALVATWTEMQAKKHLPRDFDTAEVQGLLLELLEDAYAHVSQHARPDHVSGVWRKNPIPVERRAGKQSKAA